MSAIVTAVRREVAQAYAAQHRPPAIAPRTLDVALALGTMLSSGDYEGAWKLFEASPTTFVPESIARWNGQRFRGPMVLFTDEGLGDMILFSRFVHLIKTRGDGPVVMLAPKSLTRLFARIPGLDDVIAINRVSGRHNNTHVHLPWKPEYCVNITSLPRIFGCHNPGSVPRRPYLSADPGDIKRWRPRLPQTDGLRVGLVWRGDPNNVNDAWRSLPFAMLASLWRAPGCSFVSLQVGAGEDEARSSPLPLTHLGGSEIRDFGDTAAIVAQLDLLISVDTSTANLSAAMGRPTWVLLQERHLADFRWAHGWYPTARLFHQRTHGDWSEPVEEAGAALRSMMDAQIPETWANHDRAAASATAPCATASLTTNSTRAAALP